PQQQQATAEPPGRVGSVSYLAGTVSFHDEQQDGWTKAIVNYPFSTGDEMWTEPDGRAEILVSGTRLRMQGASHIAALAIDDQKLSTELARGRIDVRAGPSTREQPVEIVTPRGTVSLLEPGDYVIDAGTTEDPTLIGVRSGNARFAGPDGTTHPVREGQLGGITGDPDKPVFEVLR